MIFKQLKLKNFKSHADTTIDFNNGITMIIGDNGAGKSSIFEAISFALYKKTTGKGISSLIRSNKGREVLEMSVELTFINNGIEYKVIRRKNKSKTSAELLKRNSLSGFDLICSGDSVVNGEIKDILQIDADLFLNAIYVRQGEIADLVAKTPAERKLLIGKLLKLEELEKAWKNALPLINNYEMRAAELKGLISSDSELSVELKYKLQEHAELSQRKKDLAKEIETLEKYMESILSKKLSYEEEKKIFEELNLKLESEQNIYNTIKKSKDELQDRVDEITKLESEKNRLEKYSKKLPIYLDFEDARNRIVDLEKEKSKQIDLIKLIEVHKSNADNKKSAYEDYVALESKIKSLNDEKSKLAAVLKLIEQYTENYKKAENDLNSLNERLSLLKSNSLEILSSFLNYDELKFINDDFNFEKLIEAIENIKNKLLEDRSSKEEDLKNKNIEISNLKNKIESSKKPISELNAVEDKCPVCQSDIDEDKKDELITSYQELIRDSEIRINNIHKEIPEVIDVIKYLSKEIKIIEDLEKDVYYNKDLSKDIKEKEEEIKEISKKLESLKTANDKLKEIESLIYDANKNHSELKESHESYVQSLGVLNSLKKYHEAKEELYIIEGKIASENERIKEAIDSDSYLTSDISKEDLNIKINDLKSKDLRFNQLTEYVRQKPKFTSKLNEKKEEIQLKLIEIESLKKNILTSRYDEEKYNDNKLLEETNSNKLLISKNSFSEISGRLIGIEPSIKSLKDSINKNKAYKEELESVNNFLILLNYLRELYSKDGIQKVLRDASAPIIQKFTKEFFEQFNFNYSDLTLDENYEISLYGPEGKATLDMVSGGEKIAIALALRLGITQAMSNGGIETILLDEPTIHLDTNRKNELTSLLRDMNVIPQMIVVTHEDSLESAVENVIKIKKDDGISKVTVES